MGGPSAGCLWSGLGGQLGGSRRACGCGLGKAAVNPPRVSSFFMPPKAVEPGGRSAGLKGKKQGCVVGRVCWLALKRKP